MNVQADVVIEEKRKALMSYFETSSDKEKINSLIQNPETVLQDLDIKVDEKFKKAVKVGLKQAFQTYSKSNHVLKSEGLLSMDESMPMMASEAESGIQFSVQAWGLVLELDENATASVVNGINIAAGISAAITAVAAVTEVGAPVAILTGIFSGFCVAYGSTISMINNGNGVYLTLTWPQIALALIVPPIPVPTVR